MHLRNVVPARTGKLLSFALCLAAVAPMARADEASHRAKVQEFLQVTKAGPSTQQQLTSLRERIDTLAKQQFGNGTLTPEQTKLRDEYLKQIGTMTDDEVGWEKIKPLMEQIYVDAFTETELDGILAFYKTPSGQAFLQKTPGVLSKQSALIGDRIKDLQPKLAQLTESYATKVKAAGPAAPAGGAAPAASPKPSLTTPKQ